LNFTGIEGWIARAKLLKKKNGEFASILFHRPVPLKDAKEFMW
jgi:hypothetical protein